MDVQLRMLVTLYRLRAFGKPRSYRAIADEPKLHGSLIYGAANGPARVAELEAGGRVRARLMHAEVVRISNGCQLLQGREDGHAQAWLCAQDERAGDAALRKVRPPTAADFPFGSLSEDDHPLDGATERQHRP